MEQFSKNKEKCFLFSSNCLSLFFGHLSSVLLINETFRLPYVQIKSPTLLLVTLSKNNFCLWSPWGMPFSIPHTWKKATRPNFYISVLAWSADNTISKPMILNIKYGRKIKCIRKVSNSFFSGGGILIPVCYCRKLMRPVPLPLLEKTALETLFSFIFFHLYLYTIGWKWPQKSRTYSVIFLQHDCTG